MIRAASRTVGACLRGGFAISPVPQAVHQSPRKRTDALCFLDGSILSHGSGL